MRSISFIDDVDPQDHPFLDYIPSDFDEEDMGASDFSRRVSKGESPKICRTYTLRNGDNGYGFTDPNEKSNSNPVPSEIAP